jgi:hypothetical protein
MSGTPSQVVVVETLDCAHRVRRHYFLPHPLSASLSVHFPEAEVCLQEFSRFVAGAKDHLSWTAPSFRAAGVVGEERLVVTFGKVAGLRPTEEMAHFEARLCHALGEAKLLLRAPR